MTTTHISTLIALTCFCDLPPELEELVERQEFWTALETVREPADLDGDQRRLFEVLDVAWPE